MEKIILIGNPNTGKTTLLNNLTKSSEHVGNWHGVTVSAIEKTFKYNGKEYALVDLPGIYSLDTYSLEEKVTFDYLVSHKDATIINICDANNIERNLLLTMQLLSIGVRPIIAVNMAKENSNIDYNKLSNELSLPVVPIDARSKKSVKTLLDVICDVKKTISISSGASTSIGKIEDIYRKINFIMKKVKTKLTAEKLKNLTSGY